MIRTVGKQPKKEIIDEINGCRNALLQKFDIYTLNAIERLIIAQIKLERDVPVPTQKQEP